MKRITYSIFLFFICAGLFSQSIETYNLFLKFLDFYKLGDFKNAEKSMLTVLNTIPVPPDRYIVAAYNNLGLVYTSLSRYEKALDCFDKAEKQMAGRKVNLNDLADVYNNKARIYNYQKSYNSALEYLEKAIKIYFGLKKPDKHVYLGLVNSYLNTGMIYYELKEYNTSLDYFYKGFRLNENMNLTDRAIPLQNIAKTYFAENLNSKAADFYARSISAYKSEFGDGYFRMAALYFDYGIFLRSTGKINEAFSAHRKALKICVKNYGEKHSLVSQAYKHIGDDHMIQNNADSALYYYQRSLIADVYNFNDTDIYKNPSLDSVIFKIRLAENLTSKAHALVLLSEKQTSGELKIIILRKGFETIQLSIQLIDMIRNNYLTEENRIYLADNEKETYISALDLSASLYSITKDDNIVQDMYKIVRNAKAAVLTSEIKENELVYTSGIPDSLIKRQKILADNISSYNNLIIEELKNANPEDKKISSWKDTLFYMNRENEKIEEQIIRKNPQYIDLLAKTKPAGLTEIQNSLLNNETVIDYFLSNQYKQGMRKMYIFLISKKQLALREVSIDSQFVYNVHIIQKHQPPGSSERSQEDFISYTLALNYMYNILIKPVEGLINGNKLIIIPDEEMGLLPFEAFLKDKPENNKKDYEGLHYLIRDYIFSFGYSSSLILKHKKDRTEKIYAFSPDYNIRSANLPGAGNETKSIFRFFGGKEFRGEKATKSNFIEAVKTPAIFHLAMHAMVDTSNSNYSYLMFDAQSDTLNNGKLYNYEIGLRRIKSPMVVLSACNSGTGKLFHGEGLISLARGFILAGASSVIKTSWEINDETSAALIDRFYYHLSEGRSKDEALRNAKLDFIKASSPSYSDPYYWASYEVVGDNSPINKNHNRLLLITAILLVTGSVIIYFRRRRIFPARSL